MALASDVPTLFARSKNPIKDCFVKGVIVINTIVVNLFGEPSAGKSTAAMDITARLKRKGIKALISDIVKSEVKKIIKL